MSAHVGSIVVDLTEFGEEIEALFKGGLDKPVYH
jgi:hypothetical protein